METFQIWIPPRKDSGTSLQANTDRKHTMVARVRILISLPQKGGQFLRYLVLQKFTTEYHLDLTVRGEG